MSLSQIPKDLSARYTFDDRGHAVAILAADFPSEFKDIVECLRAFTLKKSHILTPGGANPPAYRQVLERPRLAGKEVQHQD